jgi:hypothetical protein
MAEILIPAFTTGLTHGLAVWMIATMVRKTLASFFYMARG